MFQKAAHVSVMIVHIKQGFQPLEKSWKRGEFEKSPKNLEKSWNLKKSPWKNHGILYVI